MMFNVPYIVVAAWYSYKHIATMYALSIINTQPVSVFQCYTELIDLLIYACSNLS